MSEFPTEIELQNLPSKYLPYEKKQPLVSVRPYTFGELSQLESSSITDDVTTINFILEGINCPFPKYELTLSDFYYAAIMRKLSSFSYADYTLSYICPKCKKESQLKFKEDDIDFEELDLPEFPVIAKFSSGAELHFTPCTVQDVIDSRNKDIDLSDNVKSLAITTRNLEYEEAYAFLSNLVLPEDKITIDKVDDLLYHDIKPLFAVCKNLINKKECGHKISLSLKKGKNYIIKPFCSIEAITKDSIRFGK